MSKRGDFFWISYSDLMTSMFFIMLVLFVLTVTMLKIEQKKIITRLEEYEKIEEIKKSIAAIDPQYFEYSSLHKKHIFKIEVQYPRSVYDIHRISNSDILLPEIIRAGQVIQNTLNSIPTDDNIQYLVVIEGQASLDNYNIDDYKNNDVLSFQRALKLKEFWENNGIFLDSIPNCEFIIAGSGQGGIPRVEPDWRNPRNQRFLIHIIPKTGEI